MKTRSLMFMIATALLAFASAATVFAADNLPLDNQQGVYIGVEAATSYMHVVTEPSVDTTYTIALRSAVATAGYGNDMYSLGISGGAALPSVRNGFDEFGDAEGTALTLGVNVKAAPLKIGSVKLGVVADIKYVDDISDSVSGTVAWLPLIATLEYGSLWLWSASAIAQYQPTPWLAIYAGEKYEDLAKAAATMRVTVGPMSNSMKVEFKKVDDLSTIVGMVVMPTDKVNIIVQGGYTDSVPISVTAGVEYHF